jgi:hypothetical protein
MFYFLVQNILNKELLNEQIFSMYSYFPVDPCICNWKLMPSLAFIHTHNDGETHVFWQVKAVSFTLHKVHENCGSGWLSGELHGQFILVLYSC